MTEPKMILNGQDDVARRRMAKKILSDRIETNDQTIEEFFNKCHDDGGKFCGDSGGGGSSKGPITGKFTPSISYNQNRIQTAKAIKARRKVSKPVKDVTVGPLGAVLPNNTYASVKIKKLQKANLSKFSNDDLVAINNRLKSDYQYFNRIPIPLTVDPVEIAIAIPDMVSYLAISKWKKKRIPKQITRIETQLKKRNVKFSVFALGAVDDSIVDEDNLPTFEEEIAAVKKEFESKSPSTGQPKTPSTEVIKFIAEFLDRMEGDDDIPEGIKNQLRKSNS